ncbi:MAG: M24 family metallopeptidase [Betaproteobacteria bacterium]
MSPAPAPALDLRHARVRSACSALGLDALVVTSLPNIAYLANFTGSAAIAVLLRDRLVLITDFRYLTAIEEMRGTGFECAGLDLVRVESSYDQTLVGVLTSLGPVRIGFEAAHLTVSRFRWIEERLEGGAGILVASEGVVEQARIVKDAWEVATLREAARRLSEAAREVVYEARPGRTEREVASRIDARLRDGGFQRNAFDTIVASGPNAALPHARPGERTLTEGDLVVLDFGGVYDSYCVDLTRTVAVGAAGARARDVYAAVLDAHDRAIAAVSPGRLRFDVDEAARSTLAGRGLGDAFGHGTGHGLGLEVHEEPRIARRREGEVSGAADRLVPGMVFTIEPGAYLPGWGGVRIEDDVVVTAEGVEVLTDVPTGLIEL